MKEYNLDLKPYQNKELDEWRENFKGIQVLHKDTNLIISGAVDDIWVDKDGLLYVVDYKSTSKEGIIDNIDQEWQICYKNQMEIYQYLLRKKGYKVSNTGYFVYCNGITDKEAFDGKLEFDITLISYEGNDDWVDNTILDIYECLNKRTIPESSYDCDYCRYRGVAEDNLQ